MASSNELTQWITAWVRNHSLEPLQGGVDVDADLLSAGLLDSISFVQMLAEMEEILGAPIDLSDAAPEDFTTIRGLTDLAMRQRA